MLKTFKYSFIAVFSLAFIGLFLSVFITRSYFNNYSQKEINLVDKNIDIPYGSSLKRLSEILKDAEIISDANAFYWYMRLGRPDGNLVQAGHYEFDGSMSIASLADSLRFGRDKALTIVFKEGETLADLAEHLESAQLVSAADFTESLTSDAVKSLVKSPLDANFTLANDYRGGIEGYLFPDSYYFTKKDSAFKIIKTMYSRLIDKFNDDMHARMHEVNLSLHELLTLASIVEKESAKDFERTLIASVYLNRLRLKMRLQADPTVIYGIKDYQGNIHKADLLKAHPYNTYLIEALPPGPISSVSLASMKAVLWPLKSNYLYFVSKNDGSHEFCETLSCHNNAVKKWQIDYFRKGVHK